MASSGYTIYYSNPAKNTTPIFIADGTENSQSTSITLIGRNYPGYGQAIAQDLVQLLENFSNSSPPTNPIEGQLWFDTSDPANKKLRINDGGGAGAVWKPINGLYQQPTQPNNVSHGDIWVDTSKNQLSFYNGASFTLLGPNYSSSTKTGSYPVTLTDLYGGTHEVVINYVDDVPLEIIARDSFIPNPVINGFRGGLTSGINLYNDNLGTLQTPIYPTISGIANSALNVKLNNGTIVPADSLMRIDIPQTSKSLTIADNNSFQIGVNNSLNIAVSSQRIANFVNNVSQGQFNFSVAGVNKPLMIMDGSTQLITINDPAFLSATAGLAVNGSISASTSATVQTLFVTSTLSNSNGIANNSVQIAGGAGIAGNLYVGGNLHIQGTANISVSGTISTATNLSGGSNGQIVYQITAGSTGYVNTGTAGQVLTSSGPAAPQFISQNLLTVGTATNIAGGTNGSLPIQIQSGVTSMLAIGNTGTFLVSNGTTAIWTSLTTATSTLLGGVKIGSGINVAGDGTISVTPGSYTLTTATSSALGGVKIGSGINVAGDGTISLNTNTLVARAVNATTASFATTAGYALSFNVDTLVNQAIKATTASFATTAGYAVSFNTATLVTQSIKSTTASFATTAGYAVSFNTATLVTQAVYATTATNVINGVSFITGTVNQVYVSANTGSVTLTTPQAIATTSNVTFASVSATNITVRGYAVSTGTYTSPARTTVTGTSVSLANNTTGTFNIVGAKSYLLFNIATNVAAWVRLYTDSASRTADSTRAQNVDPVAGSGVLAEVITGGMGSQLITPGTYGFNNDVVTSSTIYCAATNLSGSTSTVTVTLTILPLEI